MTIIIRRANDSDLDWIVTQLAEFSRYYGTRFSLFSTPDQVRSAMANIIKNHFISVAVGCTPRGIITRLGFIAGIVTPHPFNPAIRLLSEQFWWVEPAHRASRAGLLLLNDFIKFGKANVDWITFALEDKSPVNARTLIKRGFKLQEKSYLMEVA